jgi:hypothetical protein
LKRKIYIILHHEIFEDGRGGHVVDEMVFQVVSSMTKALAYIKISHVAPYSWWEIQEQILDDPDYVWPEHIGYYGRKAGKLKKPPWEKCIAIFKKGTGRPNFKRPRKAKFR